MDTETKAALEQLAIKALHDKRTRQGGYGALYDLAQVAWL